MMRPGTLLDNGATVIASTDEFVLAVHIYLSRGEVCHEYVTWAIGPDGDTYHGHYHTDDFLAAAADYATRNGLRLQLHRLTEWKEP